MEYISLEKVDRPQVISCFNHAFSDYIVSFDMPDEYWYRRWHAARVDWSLSYGLIHDDELVAFIIHGVDYLNDAKTAFNCATGVIPKMRGQRLVKKLYDYFLPQFREAEIQKSTLEVIVGNDKAIRAYKGVGFQMVHRLHCFKGIMKNRPSGFDGLIIRTATRGNWPSWNVLKRYDPCWECSEDTLKMRWEELTIAECFSQKRLVGFAIFDAPTGYIYQLGSTTENMTRIVEALLYSARNVEGIVKINNIPSTSNGLCETLLTLGLENPVDQYEMQLDIT